MKRFLMIFAVVFILFEGTLVCRAEQNINVVPKEEYDRVVGTLHVTVDEKEHEIRSLIEENRINQQRLDQMHSIYGTWTTIIAVLFALFGVALPIALPYIITSGNNKKVEALKDQLLKELDLQKERNLMVNNALALASAGEYNIACDCLKRVRNLYPDDPSLDVYIANYSFRELDKVINSPSLCEQEKVDRIRENREQIEAAIVCYLKVSNYDGIYEKLMVGNVFPKSFIHELNFMIWWLYEIRVSMSYFDIVKYCKEILAVIEKELSLSDREELFDLDQTHVFVMIYKQVCYLIARLYSENHHCKTGEALEWVIRLMKADCFLQDERMLQECEALLEVCTAQ